MPKSLKPLTLATLLLILAVPLVGCGDSGKKLALVAHADAQGAYVKLISAFQETSAGKDVDFEQNYGASIERSRTVAHGLAADVVALSYSPGVDRLVKPGIVDPTWDDTAGRGIVAGSVVAFVVRKGNPKGIASWDDLAKKGVNVIAPQTATSGAARWNLVAAYGQSFIGGKTEPQTIVFLRKLLRNISQSTKSARESLESFTSGEGDVLLTTESVAIGAQKAGQPIEYVIPESTVLVEHPIAVAKSSAAPQEAQAFVDFLFTEQAQKIFVEAGYRSITDALNDPQTFPIPARLFRIADLGGWGRLDARLFDDKTGIVTRLERELGAK